MSSLHQGAGPYALSLAQLLSAHLATVPADVEPALVPIPSFATTLSWRTVKIGAMQSPGGPRIFIRTGAQGLTVNMLPIDARAKQIVHVVVVIIGIVSLLKYLTVF